MGDGHLPASGVIHFQGFDHHHVDVARDRPTVGQPGGHRHGPGAGVRNAHRDGAGSRRRDECRPGAAILAAYSGDANFAASTSAPATLLTVADAAGYGTSSLAPDEIASIFGSGLAAPVQITDSSGATLTPSLLLASPSQINMVVPTATALGLATVAVKSPSGPTFSKSISITRVAPGLFAANGGGTGPAAAQIIRVHAADQSQTVESVVALDATGKQWVATPIVFGSDSLYLVLYGTGIRNRSANANVTCSIGGKVLPVLYSAAQGGFAGLDQVNVALPGTLQGAGTVSVIVSADGQSSNAVTLLFQ